MSAVSEQINLHPSRQQLQKFVLGELPAGLNVVLAAHMEYCVDCQQASAQLEAQCASEWDDSVSAANSADFGAMLDQIVTQPQVTSAVRQESAPREIIVNSQPVSLPKILAKIASAGLSWKLLPGGISQALVSLDERTKCEFLYMPPGSKAPMHTHRGNEVMLVLDGKFSDELGDYKTADFVTRDPSHKHQPRTEKGCLCFSVLDSPMVFTEGWLRLLNPLNRLMFMQRKWFRY